MYLILLLMLTEFSCGDEMIQAPCRSKGCPKLSMHQYDNVTRLFWIHHEEPIKNPQHNKTFEIFCSFTRES